jgi:hypothetical protein
MFALLQQQPICISVCKDHSSNEIIAAYNFCFKKLWQLHDFSSAEFWQPLRNAWHLRNYGNFNLFPFCGTMATYCGTMTATRFTRQRWFVYFWWAQNFVMLQLLSIKGPEYTILEHLQTRKLRTYTITVSSSLSSTQKRPFNNKDQGQNQAFSSQCTWVEKTKNCEKKSLKFQKSSKKIHQKKSIQKKSKNVSKFGTFWRLFNPLS